MILVRLYDIVWNRDFAIDDELYELTFEKYRKKRESYLIHESLLTKATYYSNLLQHKQEFDDIHFWLLENARNCVIQANSSDSSQMGNTAMTICHSLPTILPRKHDGELNDTRLSYLALMT